MHVGAGFQPAFRAAINVEVTRTRTRAEARDYMSLTERKGEQPVASRNGYILPAIHGIGDRAIGDLAAEHGFPEEYSIPAIQRIEIALTSACKYEVRCRCEDADVGNLRHLEYPLDIAGLDVNSLDRPVISFIFGARVRVGSRQSDIRRETATGIVHTGFVFLSPLCEHRGCLFPCRNVEKSGPWIESRVVPIRSSLVSGIDANTRC